jgi:hypothetical protein
VLAVTKKSFACLNGADALTMAAPKQRHFGQTPQKRIRVMAITAASASCA